jgi:hypothetical protein
VAKSLALTMDDSQEKSETKHAEVPVQHGEVPVADARQAADAEQNMTLIKAIKTYPKAIGWSVLLSSTLIMEGYGKSSSELGPKHCSVSGSRSTTTLLSDNVTPVQSDLSSLTLPRSGLARWTLCESRIQPKVRRI